jgi:hypothetical protein
MSEQAQTGSGSPQSAPRMDALTPRSARQLADLSPELRTLVSEHLLQPVEAHRIELVKRLKRFRVFHWDVSESIRVCYRTLKGRNVVLDISTHSGFNHFANHYAGDIPGRLIPLGEVIDMSRQPNQNGRPGEKASHPNGTTADAAPTSNVVQPTAEEMAAFYQAFRTQVAVASECLSKEQRAETDLLLQMYGEQAKTALKQATAELRGELATEAELARDGLKTVLSRLTDTETSLRQGLTDLGTLIGRTHSGLDDHRRRFETQLARMGEGLEQVGAARELLAVRLDGLGAELLGCLSRLEQCEAQLETDRTAAEGERQTRAELETTVGELVAARNEEIRFAAEKAQRAARRPWARVKAFFRWVLFGAAQPRLC